MNTYSANAKEQKFMEGGEKSWWGMTQTEKRERKTRKVRRFHGKVLQTHDLHRKGRGEKKSQLGRGGGASKKGKKSSSLKGVFHLQVNYKRKRHRQG